MANESQRVEVDGGQQSRPGGSVAPWMLVLVGVVSGVGLAVVFGVTGRAPIDPAPPPTLAPSPPTSSTTPVTAPASTGPEDETVVAAPPGLDFPPLWVVTGSYPTTSVQRLSPGEVDLGFGLPWASSGFSTDASGALYGFTQPSTTARSLFLGSGGRYVALSTTVGTWAWHATEPATLAWIDTARSEPTVMVTRIGLAPIGDRGEGLESAVDTAPLVPARPDESVLGFTEVGVVLGATTATGGPSTVRVVDSNGEVVAEANVVSVYGSFSPDGWGLVERSEEGSAGAYQIVDSSLEAVADLGSVDRTGGGPVGWSPEGQTVAMVEYRAESGVDFHLELWDRKGELRREVPLGYRVWDVTWTSDGSQIVMVATDNSGWQGLLFVDPDSGEVTPLEIGADPVVAVDIAED